VLPPIGLCTPPPLHFQQQNTTSSATSPSEPFRLGASAVACTRLMRCATDSGQTATTASAPTGISRQRQRAGDKQPASLQPSRPLRSRPHTTLAAIATALGIRQASAAPFPSARPYLICSRFLSGLALRPLSSPSGRHTHRHGFAAASPCGSGQQQW
jgi:hypothetical protein